MLSGQAKEQPVSPLQAPLSGLRDLVPPAAAARRRICGTLNRVFATHGYQLATLPMVERETVFLRGLPDVDTRDLMRFVDPESGEVAVLRPDVTPQVARLVATELADRAAPHRIAYEGTVFRSRSTRARTHRQLLQAGVECLGRTAPEGDSEVIRLAAHTLAVLGLDATIELHSPRLTSNLFSTMAEPLRDATERALQRKDITELGKLLETSNLTRAEQEAVLELPRCYGPARDVLKGFDAAPFGPAAEQQIHVLQTIITRLGDCEGHELTVDLGEPRGRRYYTGISFQLLAPGPGEPVGRGGRYDNLVSAYGVAMPATGFALMVDALIWALESAGNTSQVERACGISAAGVPDAIVARLRQEGWPVAPCESPQLDAHVRDWNQLAGLLADGDEIEVRTAQSQTRVATNEVDALIEVLEALKGELPCP